MPNWLSGLFAFLQGVIGLLLERKGAQRGRAEATVEAIIEEKKNEQAAKDAIEHSDPERSERLRRKYNRRSK